MGDTCAIAPQENATQLVGSGSVAVTTFGGMTTPWNWQRPGHMVNAFGDLFSQADCTRSWLNDGMSCTEWLYCSWQADAAGAQIQHKLGWPNGSFTATDSHPAQRLE